jgi:hypothetical protein
MTELVELAEKLDTEGERFSTIFRGLTGAQWDLEVYTEGAVWTIRDVLSHFVTSERGLLKLFQEIRLGGAGVPDDFSIDRYNASQQGKTRELKPSELLDQYEVVRAGTVEWVSGLEDSELEIIGRHPFLGKTTLREMIKMLYVHNQIHYRDFRKKLIQSI